MSFTNPKPAGYAVGEKLPSSHVNQIWADLKTIFDAIGVSATYGWTAGLYPAVSSRSIDYDQDLGVLLLNQSSRFTNKVTVGNGIGADQDDVTDQGLIIVPLTNLPRRGTIASVTMVVDGNGAGASHGALPAIMPKLQLNRIDQTTVTLRTQVTDASGTVGAYEADHNVTDSPAWVLSPTARYYARITGEGSSNSVAGALKIRRLYVTCTVAEIGA